MNVVCVIIAIFSILVVVIIIMKRLFRYSDRAIGQVFVYTDIRFLVGLNDL